MELFRNRTLRRVPLALAAASVVVLGACSDGSSPAGPVIPETPEPVPGLRTASFVADVSIARKSVSISAPAGGLNLNAIADYFGLEPGHPELSILGGDVVDILPDASTFDVGPVGPNLKRRVAFSVVFRNRLKEIAVVGPDLLPIPPANTSSPILFPFENVATVTQGGVTGSGNEVIVESPSQGTVTPSDTIWTGPAHNFFNDESCSLANNDCFLYKALKGEGADGPGGAVSDTVAGFGNSEPVRVGYDVDATLAQFRSRLIVAGNLIDGTPNVDPTADFTPAGGACTIGTPIALTSTSADSDGFIVSSTWDFGADGTTDATGPTATYTPTGVAAYSEDIRLSVTDNRGGTASQTYTFNCVLPPANASVTKSLRTTGTPGAPVTTVSEGGTYKYVITVNNPNPVAPLTGFTINDQLDSDINFASVVLTGVGSYNSGTGLYSYGPVTLNPGTTLVIELRFTVLAGTSGGTLDNTVTIASPDDTNPGDNTASVTAIPINVPPNIFGRFVATAGGADITSAAGGATVLLEICTSTLAVEAIDAQLTIPAGTLTLGADFDSGTSGGTCAGTGDELNDFFFPNITSSTSINFGLSALTPPSTSGNVGIARITITLPTAGYGAFTPTLAIPNFQVSGGVQGSKIIDMATLTVN